MIVAVDTNCILPGRVGGIEQYTLTLVRCLIDHAPWVERVELLTRTENDEVFRAFEGERCGVRRVPRGTIEGQAVGHWASALRNSPSKAERALREHQEAKRRIIEEVRADVVHFPGNTINPIDLERPAVLNIHDLQHRHLPQYFSAQEMENRERWWTASARRADALVATSEFVAGDLRKELGVAGDKIVVTHPPVDPAFLRGQQKGYCAVSWERFFLYPAAYWPHKNHAGLVRAFVAARLAGVGLVLTGTEDEELLKMIDQAGAGERVVVMGRVERSVLMELYGKALGVVVPSEYEASSLPVLEAMSSGCPVAVSAIPPLLELVGGAGLVFDPHDEASITAAIARLARDEHLRERLKRRGLERAREFTPERYLAGVRKAYEMALSSRRQRVAA